MLSEPSYLAARMVASTIESHFAMHLTEARKMGKTNLASDPPVYIIEAIIDTAFWASLQREEGHSPKVSIAYLSPEQADRPLNFGRKLRLTPHNLNKLSPAVENPGIHLAVWNDGDDAYIWGTTHGIPHICFVIEVIEPGLVVIKHSRIDGFGKFVNIAILKGDKIKIVDETNSGMSDCPDLLASLLGMPLPSFLSNSVNVWVELAASMQKHHRGGIVLLVPSNSDEWRKSIVQPIGYPVIPAYTVISELIAQDSIFRKTLEWQERLLQAIDIIGGFTAVDGATVLTQNHELLAFGAKITRADGSVPVEEIVVTEPTIDSTPCRMHPAQNGGTRHLAAAQFVHDQHDAIALVASQDGNFTIFAWSNKLKTVHAHRIDILLL
ncbi:putative sensor domain DACNV-containing protein [Mucilaginibacter agri]|uniref:Probable sensor domain-containing protein n=1 Tax=Mucilaginibacter agri TaxID=2695265 RepID=A0A966DST9_9SPHI|nr:hypothetical protein [Mucilaginibacter agri]NCD69955.1 hypothetical protein [Mucilaginibacter agri]